MWFKTKTSLIFTVGPTNFMLLVNLLVNNSNQVIEFGIYLGIKGPLTVLFKKI